MNRGLRRYRRGMARRIIDTITTYWALGGLRRRIEGGLVVTHPRLPPHPLGDFLQLSAETTAESLPGVLAAAERQTGRPGRAVRLHPAGPLDVEPKLIIDGWTGDAELQLVLTGPPISPGGAGGEDVRAVTGVAGTAVPRTEIRPGTESDWPAVARLFRLDHEEEDRRAGVPTRSPEVTNAAVALRRELSRHADLLVAAVDGSVVGFVICWAGVDGLGIVEDVFVRSDHRRRGIATALVVTAVTAARRRGARELVIAADPTDHPRHLYARLGFRPTLVTRSYRPPEAATLS
ncbi:putative acetyltransferase [Actinoalloteichus hoggarensis]|uniref:Putative acetyltransferase n=2 Tax=Actinoalloteichus hoggarensis TaxID=1470176 RepID=A0A221W9Q9_9PSEU|nr:putative acetyltransferase [Actinoalloteichus hoggarensis]